MQVGAVEDAAVGVAKAPEQKLQADRPVGDVGGGEHEPPPGFEQGPHARQQRPRVAQVLDQVAADDRVEARRLERQLDRLGVADENLVAELAGALGGQRVELDPGDGGACAGQALGQVSARTADVEDAPGGHHLQQQPVAAEGAVVELDVARLGAGVAWAQDPGGHLQFPLSVINGQGSAARSSLYPIRNHTNA